MIGSNAWWALMRRNLIYRKRNWVGTLFELALPVIFVSFLLAIKNAVKNGGNFEAELVPAYLPSNNDTYKPLSFQDYVTAMQAKRQCVEVANPGANTTTFWISGIPKRGENWQVPLVKCDSRRCKRDGEDAQSYCEYSVIAVVGTDAGGKQRAESFRTWLLAEYPALNTSMPFDFQIVKTFPDKTTMDDYVRAEAYGDPGLPKIAMGIVWTGNDPKKYVYSLRQNSTNFNSPEAEWKPTSFTTPNTDRVVDSYAKDDFDVCIPADGTPKQGFLEESCTGQYLYNGILTFQRLVGDFILADSGAEERGTFVSESGVAYVAFPTFAYEKSGFYGDIGGLGALLITLGLLYPVAIMIIYVTREKQLGQKELMKMMSVTESDIGWSWFATFFLFNLVSATLTAFVSMALYENSKGAYLWIFWALTFLSITVFSMFLSTFTSKSNRAVTLGLLLFFVGVFLTNSSDYQEGDGSVIALISLHPTGAMTYILLEIGRLEDQGVGLRGSTVGSTDSPSGFTFNKGIQALLINSLFWGILTWYFNRIIKQDYGQALKPWFPFMRSYWLPKRDDTALATAESMEEYNSSVPFEVVGRKGDGKTDVEIRKLKKVFGKTIAIDGLSLTMYGGQITALLGHNGAGKTTTINVITGALAPTEGDVIVARKDIRSQMSAIRSDLGICPQHDCLFDLLTVREHIQFFSRLKGMYRRVSIENAEHSVDQALHDIALFEKRFTLSKNLSGGMKRKLSVAIAFCGGSKVVLLDEPTSGMDPFSRRFTWNVIRRYREHRCIILTTHFMDEADVLGDRIAIMAHGQLRCAGSSLFLKKQYGVGYQLTIEKRAGGGVDQRHVQDAGDEENAEAGDEVVDDDDVFVVNRQHTLDSIREIIKTAVPEASNLTNSPTEVSYQLPMGASSRFAPLLKALDAKVDERAINSYGVSLTTMDEVFLAVARGDTHEKSEMASSSVMHLGKETLILEDKSVQSGMDLEKEGLFGRHLWALFRKRGANFRRDKKAWLCTTILPSIFVLIGFFIFKFAGMDRNYQPLRLTLDDFNIGAVAPQNIIVFNSPDSEYTCQPGQCAYEGPADFVSQGESYEFCGLEARLNESNLCSINYTSDIMQTIDDAAEAVLAETVHESSLQLSTRWNETASTRYGAIFISHEPTSSINNVSTYNDTVREMCLSNVANYVDPILFCSKLGGGYGFVIQYNYTALHGAPLFQSLADEALARFALNDTTFTIDSTIDPLPLTKVEVSYGKAEDAFMAWFLVVISFPFIAGAFAVFVVQERETKSKHLQTVAGVAPTAYWLSTIIWDTINYQIPLWITVILMFAFDVEVLTRSDRGVLSGVIILLFLYGPAAASWSYCVSFAFKSASMCNMFIIIFGFLIGMGGTIAVWILRILGEAGNRKDANETLLDAAKIVSWILRFTPSFCLGHGLYNAIYVDAFDYWEGKRITVWTEPVLLIEVIFLACQSVVYLLLAILIDKWSSNPRMVSIWRRFVDIATVRFLSSKDDTGNDLIASAYADDDDVKLEETRVMEGATNEDLIVLSELSKIYDTGKVAVNRVSLGIPRGECFGLLGINGAGKTTTLQMLTAEFPPTSGDATLAGFSVRSEPEKTRRRIGYCPQFDAHFENMTGKEHVEMYAAIKGIPKENVNVAVEAKLREVGLVKDSDRLSSEYSGGMKRRLSLACALIGEPQIVFLDECTTGVDPVARREIWEVISNMVTRADIPDSERPSVILTTHSMEECEALCPRIGIMAHGRLRCLGSAQHLKAKFGKGFQVELKVAHVRPRDEDYLTVVQALSPATDPRSQGTIENAEDGQPAVVVEQDVFFTLEQAKAALYGLTGDDFLSSMIVPENPTGYIIWNEATSKAAGCPLDELAAFATGELRLQSVETFMRDMYPDHVLRERQDTKVRYEVPSAGIRISGIFEGIEANKVRLRLSDYGVSQTSLEQVFNMHAAEAERLKEGRIDS